MFRRRSLLTLTGLSLLLSGCYDKAAWIVSPSNPVSHEKLFISFEQPANPLQEKVLIFLGLWREGIAQEEQNSVLQAGRQPVQDDEFHPAIEARHPLLGASMAIHRKPYNVVWESCGLATELAVRHPADWKLSAVSLETPLLFGPDVPENIWSKTLEEPGFVLSTVQFKKSNEGAIVSLHAPQPWWRNGGPVYAAGQRTGETSDSLLMRLGYEVGLGDRGILSFNLESDMKDLFQLNTTLEAATWTTWVIPSLAFGLGFNTRLAPDVEIGGRMQFTAQWDYFGFVAAYDFFPNENETVLMGRISL